jgi:hypothetical protein
LRFCARLIVVLLVMLLGLQLSGLSCLDDWRTGHSTEFTLLGTDHSASSPDGTELGADGCPCHLLFSSSPQSSLDMTERGHPMNTMAPAGWLPTLASAFFHPPLA